MSLCFDINLSIARGHEWKCLGQVEKIGKRDRVWEKGWSSLKRTNGKRESGTC